MKKDFKRALAAYIEQEIETLKKLNIENVNTVMNVLETARNGEKNIFVCGNGGSAATASHFAADFNKGINEKLALKYNLECLSDNTPLLMAIANDISYDEIFTYPLKNKMKPGDIIIGISGSGNSSNVVRAFEFAKQQGGITIALVGYDGGKLKELADHYIHVNVNNMQIAEDIHMILDHLMMYVLVNSDIE